MASKTSLCVSFERLSGVSISNWSAFAESSTDPLLHWASIHSSKKPNVSKNSAGVIDPGLLSGYFVAMIWKMDLPVVSMVDCVCGFGVISEKSYYQ